MFSLIEHLFNDPLGFLREALYRVPAILIALVLHEWAHAYIAYRRGDPTAKMLGRLTLNPMKHLEPLGTLLLLVAGFGWAKPVPINPANFKKPRRDDFLVSIAGVTMNLLLYALFFVGYYFFYTRVMWPFELRRATGGFLQSSWPYFENLLLATALVNLSIAVFNLLPVPPLDGSHVLNDLILKRDLFASRQIAQYGMAALLLLSFTGLLGKGLGVVTGFVVDQSWSLLYRVFGV